MGCEDNGGGGGGPCGDCDGDVMVVVQMMVVFIDGIGDVGG